jgi:hypothetical protein
LITSNSHLSFIYYAIEACTILAGRMVARIIHISHTTLTNPGKTYHTCIAPHFLSVFLFFFFAVYRSGAFGWIDAAQVSKKKNLSYTYPASSQTASSCAVDIVIIVFCRFFALRIALYSILISIARLVDFQ